MRYPDAVVFHVPHDSTLVPQGARGQFLLNDESLSAEMNLMTDHFTHDLFVHSQQQVVVRSPVSRLVVDVERFEDDTLELMAKRGMGVVYTVTSSLNPLRRRLTDAEKCELIEKYYRPHHVALDLAAAQSLAGYGHCLIVDCHSFPNEPLPYELYDDAVGDRPDICIGTDDFHTPVKLMNEFVKAFTRMGWRVGVNTPFSGAMVPNKFYRKDPRVMAIMVEVNRGLYMSSTNYQKIGCFGAVRRKINDACAEAVDEYRRANARY